MGKGGERDGLSMPWPPGKLDETDDLFIPRLAEPVAPHANVMWHPIRPPAQADKKQEEVL